MNPAVPADQNERLQAVNPACSVHVEAPAGSGKTTVLLKRFLALLAQVREPEEILALTFTRKAAGELRARLQGELGVIRETQPPSVLEPHAAELRDLAQAAGRRHVGQVKDAPSLLERLQVSTFHSFCAQLLRLYPQAAGLPPDFRLLEDDAAARLQQDAVERLRRRLAAQPASDPVRQALVRRLVRLNNNWPSLARELENLLARRDIVRDLLSLARESPDPARYEAILHDLESLLRPDLQQLALEFNLSDIGRQWPDFHRFLQECGAGLADDLPPAVPAPRLDDLFQWGALADGLLTGNGDCYRVFRKPKFPPEINNSPWFSLLQNLPEALVVQLRRFHKLPRLLLQPDEVEALQDLILLLAQALEVYEELCRARRALDFTSLEQKALEVLDHRQVPQLLERLDRRLTHLLVDEFQDTSYNQMTLLCRLLAGWQGDPGRSLMVVGDPKQSIFGWRQARLELFFRCREEKGLPDCRETPTLQPLTLTTNFRSTETLIAWVNDVFGQTIMADRREAGVEFREAAPKPGADQGSPPQLILFPDQDEKGRTLEAYWLARELAQLGARQRQLPPEARESIGVLLFYRTHLHVYLAECRQAGLSLRVKDGLPLGDSLAVRHLHNLATALVQPHNDMAWAALLRGLAGPQPLSLLAQVAKEDGDFWSDKLQRLAGSAGSRVCHMIQATDQARDRVGRDPLAEILTAWMDRVNGWQQAAAWEGPQGVANARTYLELLAQAEGATPVETLSQASYLLERAYQPPDPQAEDSPVEVLTVHAAKGLEFDHVFLPFLDWQPRLIGKNNPPFLLEEIPGTGRALIALAKPYVETGQSVLYRTLKQVADQSALGEARRLFYVAVTRARKQLKMSAVLKTKKDGDWQFPNHSPLGWLRQHYADELPQPGVTKIWPDPPLPVTVWDQAGLAAQEDRAGAPPGGAASGPDLPEAYELQPEPWPYGIRRPSELVAPPSPGPAPQAAAEAIALVRGELSHRLLETLSRGGRLPDPAALAAALRPAAVGDAEALAAEILAEIQACAADPFLARLLASNLPEARSEWLLESWHETGVLYRGQIDRLVYDGQQWWLLDYKTSRPTPGEAWEDFLAGEVEKYRPQLLAYREMAAKFFNLPDPGHIQAVLYFTACQRHILL